MLKLAVIGKDVSKSASPRMHAFIAQRMGNEIEYTALSIAEEAFEREIEGVLAAYDGLNVTIPYKLAVMPHLVSINGDAALFGAVNTVTARDRAGFNTDGLGFMLMLRSCGVQVRGASALVLGAGGSGRSVAKKLAQEGASVYVYNRRAQKAVDLAAECEGVTALTELAPRRYDVIINATGVGMHDTVGVSPVGEDVLSTCDTAVDLIYVPAQSEFLRLAEGLGKRTINGQAMLFYQAYYAQCIFCGVRPDEGQARRLFNAYLKEV